MRKDCAITKRSAYLSTRRDIGFIPDLTFHSAALQLRSSAMLTNHTNNAASWSNKVKCWVVRDRTDFSYFVENLKKNHIHCVVADFL